MKIQYEDVKEEIYKSMFILKYMRELGRRGSGKMVCYPRI